MSRRHHLKHISASRDARASIGDGHVDVALGQLKRTAQIAAGVMARYACTRETTLSMLFADDTIAKLKQVRGMVTTLGHIRAYTVVPGVDLHINYDGAMVPAVDDKMLALNQNASRLPPLLAYIAEVKAVHDRFEEVKAVLKWFNRNATPGAVRYYWPAAMKLCPNSRAWDGLQDVPSRYTTPEDIGDWIQPIKDAAATVAGSAMLPSDAVPREQGNMWLTFKLRTVKLSEHSSYETDTMVYHI